MYIIDPSIFTLLPFSSEPLSSWDENTDVLQFLVKVYDQEVKIVTKNNSTKYNFKEVLVEHYFPYYKKYFEKWLETQIELIKQYNLLSDKQIPPNLLDEPEFGKAGKYFIAWICLIRHIRSESSFFCIEHINETLSEIDSSMDLVSGFHYKQGLIVLRGLLEEVVKPIYFSIDENAYRKWRASKYQPLKINSYNNQEGEKTGILDKLIEKNIINHEMKEEFSVLYKELSGCIHGERKWFSQGFEYKKLYEWCKFLSRVINIAIQLIIINVNEWEKIKLQNPNQRRCSYCHNTDEKSILRKKIKHGKEIYWEQKCYLCQNTMTFKDNQPSPKVIAFNDDGTQEFYFFENS